MIACSYQREQAVARRAVHTVPRRSLFSPHSLTHAGHSMRPPALFALLCLVAIAAAQRDEAPSEEPILLAGEAGRSDLLVELEVNEVRKVQTPTCTTGRHHDVQVTLAEHNPLPTVATWHLTIKNNDSERKSPNITAQSPNQTVLVFEGDITNANAILINAKDKSEELVAVGHSKVNMSGLDARLAWVGAPYEPPGSSLRVDVGSLEEVVVGGWGRECRREESPCYFLAASFPENISRCLPPAPPEKNLARACDQTMTHFTALPRDPEVELSGSNLTVRAWFNSTPAVVEVVAYDPEEPATTLYSRSPYRCTLLVSPRAADEPGLTEYHCRQTLVVPVDKKLDLVMVLVVAVDTDRFVLQSGLVLHDERPPEKDNLDVIVGSVVGAICGIVLIASIVYYFVKEHKNKKSGSGKNYSTRYQPTATSDPQPKPASTAPITTPIPAPEPDNSSSDSEPETQQQQQQQQPPQQQQKRDSPV